MTLSDKKTAKWEDNKGNKGYLYLDTDVREFIKKLKNELTQEFDTNPEMNDLIARAIIDKLAGEELIKSEGKE